MYDNHQIGNIVTHIGKYLKMYYVHPSIQTQHLSGAGEIYLLEKKLASFYQKKHAICFNNATTALQALSLALDLNGCDILTSPITWGGSLSPFLLHGNSLRFSATNSDSLNLSAIDLPNALTSKTKAVLSVDFGGTPADSKAIKKFCTFHNLLYISDSAQSFGAVRENRQAGFHADAVVLSFSPQKLITTVEGGCVLTDSDMIYEKLLWYSQHPSRQKAVLGISKYNEYAPLNGRMHPLSAILLHDMLDAMIGNLRDYQERCFCAIQELAGASLIELPTHIKSASDSTYFNINLKLKESMSIQQVNKFLRENNTMFYALDSDVRFIPSDPFFKSQFRNKYSLTSALRLQMKTFTDEKRIRLCCHFE